MLPLGVSIGLAVRMGNIVASDTRRAQLIAAWCMVFIAVVALSVSGLMFYLRHEIIGLFTSDEEATRLALSIWPFLCYYNFLIYLMGISTAILRALGMQWRAAGITSGSLYGLTLPSVVFFAVYKQGGLVVQWRVLAVCYTVLQIVLSLGYLLLNWEGHAAKVRESIARMAAGQMRDMSFVIPREDTPLLV